ncbi:MAG: hypothetical protein D8M59_02860 [Planctomycetes bacterium]|nr:hypothetical protein [Planctomycetota bacterium]NOG52936.1 hypothetical protein [Planctomycetota bacterium]
MFVMLRPLCLVLMAAMCAPPAQQETDPGGRVQWPGVTVDLDRQYVDVDAMSGVRGGWLEQVACTLGTREHESVVYVKGLPSRIHAGLLLLGLEPGKPGRWTPRADESGMLLGFDEQPPVGPRVAVNVVYRIPVRPGSSLGWFPDPVIVLEVPASVWVMDYHSGKPLPAEVGWVFGGSGMFTDYTGRERYIADVSGSVVGIVTFGDEMLGWSRVVPDAEDISAPEWVPNAAVMPPFGSPVILRLRPLDPIVE